MAIKDAMIAMVLNTVINRINNNFDMNQLLHEYNAEGRTMTVIVTDLGEGTGFSVVDGALSAGNLDESTCRVSMSKAVLAAVVTNKMTQQQAFLMGEVKIESNERLRDSIILNKIFDEMKEVIVKK